MWNAIGFALAVIGSVTVVCLIFKKQFIDLFPRLKNLGFVSFSQKDDKPDRDLRAGAEALLHQLDNELIREQETLLSTNLKQHCGLGVEAVPVLLRYVSAMAIAYRFLDDYIRIYGSQVNLLEHLNDADRAANGNPAESLRTFYSIAAIQYPEMYKNDTFDRWLGFLKDRLFVREDNGQIRLTLYGREFLTHLAKTGWSKNRVG